MQVVLGCILEGCLCNALLRSICVHEVVRDGSAKPQPLGGCVCFGDFTRRVFLKVGWGPLQAGLFVVSLNNHAQSDKHPSSYRLILCLANPQEVRCTVDAFELVTSEFTDMEGLLRAIPAIKALRNS